MTKSDHKTREVTGQGVKKLEKNLDTRLRKKINKYRSKNFLIKINILRISLICKIKSPVRSDIQP